jgi:hypothetical protein
MEGLSDHHLKSDLAVVIREEGAGNSAERREN